MKTLKKKRRIQTIILAFAFLALAASLIGYSMRDGIAYYRDPSAIVADPPGPDELFRIGGLVEPGSLTRGEPHRFRVTDGGASVAVAFSGVLPDLFDEGQGMIGQGTYDGQVFTAREILAKHDETYMPKEVIDSLQEHGVYQAPNGS